MITTVPEEVADFKVLSSGPNSITLAWLPPRFPNGVITKYRIAWEPYDLDGKKEKYQASGNEEQMTIEIKRLKENMTYTFWVAACNSLGRGKPSDMLDIKVTSKGI